jgi:hypothetical protein
MGDKTMKNMGMAYKMIEVIKKLVKGERSDNRYQEIYSEKKIEQLYHFWEHV